MRKERHVDTWCLSEEQFVGGRKRLSCSSLGFAEKFGDFEMAGARHWREVTIFLCSSPVDDANFFRSLRHTSTPGGSRRRESKITEKGGIPN